eukprot:CAMPEP_0119144840 /NCGR_PEP_ID=MMETSP1310-20130426/36590_1 /TAXON_ID=464262 /ORGANISM="Genus nov. species nov., Strain RCC2339" /LENGTH=82 /DNA_ID=CAMNT_0007136619 /DNA_START=1 /DNA_END=246 /DNA_ORIENTATION=+
MLAAVERSVTRSPLARAVEEMLHQYLSIEEYYMMESVQRAIDLDHATEDSKTSTLVDHVFFVLQECTRRTLSCGRPNVLCAL